ncbi:hypothetical protein CTZ27_09520 [Streptomyces griseocarneus]|nr:hypothetical protein CTZ27_09520 [Streptomyces griseocarneus]
MPVRYTYELLAEAARVSTSYGEAVRWCGGTSTPGSRRYIREKMAAAGTDTSHFTTRQVRHTEARLRELVADSYSLVEVVRRLGINPVGGNQAHISRRIAALGISIFLFSTGGRSGPKRASGNLFTLDSPPDGRTPGERLRPTYGARHAHG